MNIGAAFLDYYNRILLSDDQIELIKARFDIIIHKLDTHYYPYNSERHGYFVGSYGRDTEIEYSDIDMMYILPFEKFTQYNNRVHGHSDLLQDVKNVLKEKYYNTSMKADGQIISLEFWDGLLFEVLPVFKKGENTYIFADTNNGGSWKITNPIAEQIAMKEMNHNTNKNLKRLCRLMRSWKIINNVNISGIMIDILAYRFIQDWEHKDKSFLYYDYMTRDFLNYLTSISQSQSKWMAMGSNRYIYFTPEFQYKAKQAYSASLCAIDAARANDESSELFYWRYIYGSKFGL